MTDNQRMPAGLKKVPKNHLRAWREFRGMTQAQLAEAIGTTANVISQLETETRGLSDKWMRKLAVPLGISPGYLLDHNPNDLDTRWTEAVESVDPANRKLAIELLRPLQKRLG